MEIGLIVNGISRAFPLIIWWSKTRGSENPSDFGQFAAKQGGAPVAELTANGESARRTTKTVLALSARTNLAVGCSMYFMDTGVHTKTPYP